MFKRFSVGFAAGYVLGARAGQKRYDQITDLADRVVKMPGVNQLAERASEAFTPENGRHVFEVLMDRARAMGSGGAYSESGDDFDDYDEDEDEDEEGDDDGVDDDYDDDVVDEDEGDYDEGDDGDMNDGEFRDVDDSGEDHSDEDDSGKEYGDAEDMGDDDTEDGLDDDFEDDGFDVDDGCDEDDGSQPHGGRIRSLAAAAVARGRVD